MGAPMIFSTILAPYHHNVWSSKRSQKKDEPPNHNVMVLVRKLAEVFCSEKNT